ncbi:phytanoyl-CoA dioxygenase [Kineococcus sp. R8]|uniref:phytanoyl-CoA dioxygenase family protein n=1 Tax=Kineococcus siccus TaxID=2696567 RepID=UPI0014121189|nr:phytanoyl-CoA dioxygenase family protein [Kineococcus siccus]NAZ83629.1 phytanoyl-CoA dioxygenase [Kineococcus siccus]
MTTTADSLQTAYPLTAETVARFREDGFVKLSQVLDPDVLAYYEKEITAKVKEVNTQHLPLEERTTYGRAFLQVANLWQHSEVVKEFVFSQRLARIAAALLEVDGVRLYHDQALYKESGGGITPWHADQYYWPLSSDRTVTVWVPLQETPLEMGPLSFARGSQHFEFGRDLPISDESEAALQVALAEHDFPLAVEPFALGDVSFHTGWTFHRAGANSSGAPRAVMTVIYMDADIRLTEPANDQHRSEVENWMPGTAVGEVPASPLNPELYRAS